MSVKGFMVRMGLLCFVMGAVCLYMGLVIPNLVCLLLAGLYLLVGGIGVTAYWWAEWVCEARGHAAPDAKWCVRCGEWLR